MARATKRLSGYTMTGARAPGILVWPFPCCARFSAGLQRPCVLGSGSWSWTGSSDCEDMAREGPWQVLLRWGLPWVTDMPYRESVSFIEKRILGGEERGKEKGRGEGREGGRRGKREGRGKHRDREETEKERGERGERGRKGREREMETLLSQQEERGLE